MKTFWGTAFITCILVAVFGCVSSSSSSWTMKTINKDGVVVQQSSVSASEAKDFPRSNFDAVVKDGRVSWWLKVISGSERRTGITGQLNVHTTAGTVLIEFTGTIPAGVGKEVVFKQDNIEVKDLPKEAVNVKEESGNNRVNPLVTPGLGTEIYDGTPANWPDKPLEAKVSYLPIERVAEKTIVIPAPDLEAAITGIEINEKGGRKFFWVITAINNEDRPISITVRTTWSVNTGEKILPVDLNFNLAAKGKDDAKRLISGPPITLTKPFKEVTGVARLIEKKYVR